MKMKFTKSDLEGMRFIGEGTHEVVIDSAEKQTSKNGNNMAVLTLKADDGRERKSYFALTEKAQWKIAQLALACGISENILTSGDFDFPKDVMKKRFIITVFKTGTRIVDGEEKNTYGEEFSKIIGSKEPGYDKDEIPF